MRAGRVWRSSRKIKNTSRKGKLTFTSKNILTVWCLWLNKSLLMSISYAHLTSLWVLGNVYSQLIAFNLHRNIFLCDFIRGRETLRPECESKRIHKGYWYRHQDWVTTEHFINLTFFRINYTTVNILFMLYLLGMENSLRFLFHPKILP